jgi:preprotein translocase subunit SecD
MKALSGSLFGLVLVSMGWHGLVTSAAAEKAQGKATLEFRIVANEVDDKVALRTAEGFFAESRQSEPVKAELKRLALEGKPPPAPRSADAKEKWAHSYEWVEVGAGQLRSLDLDRAAETDPDRNTRWKEAAEARGKGAPLILSSMGRILLYSRECQQATLSREEREQKGFDYFFLTRLPGADPKTGESRAITGKYLEAAREVQDLQEKPAVEIRLNEKGGDLFYKLTKENEPGGPPGNEFYRHLAIILDGRIITAPALRSAIRRSAWITGNFSEDEVRRMVQSLEGK